MVSWSSLAVAVVATAITGFIAAVLAHRSKFSTIPGPASTLIRGDLPFIPEEKVAGGRLRSILDCLVKYGGNEGILRLHIPMFRTLVFVSNPDMIKEIMVSNRADWTIADREALRAVTGDGLLVIKGDYWKFQRELINPMFHFQHLEPMQATFAKCAEGTLSRLADAADSGTIVDIHAFLMQLTLDVIGRTAFALDLAAQTSEPSQVAVLLTEFLNTSEDAPGRIPSKARRKKLEIVRMILRPVIAARMAEVRAGSTAVPKDLMTLLCAAKDPVSGGQMTEEQVLAEVMTFLFAGHDTTANLMAWFVAAMGDHPTIRSQLLQELDVVFGDGPVDASRVGECELLDCAIKEVLRHHAPVPMFARVPARHGVTLSNGKYSIPQGTLTLMAPWVVHHHPLLWKDPDVFDPSRFATSAHGNAVSAFSYIPFSCGPRRCIGSNFANMESRLVLAMIYHKFDLEVVDEQVFARVGVVRRPAGGLHVRVTKRR